jgi:SSS family solute:Na+ symporter
MLFWFVIAYWLISVAIGLIAATRVHNTRDFAVAGRHLPFYMVTATVFATWFGAEAVLGVPATFLNEGLRGVVADPFGSSMCLILVGLFFAAPLYRMNLLTIGDFYKKRYGRGVEVLTTVAIVISYLGWVGAQITALGLVFNVVSGGEISKVAGMWIGSITILVYTLFGGMWAVAVTDFLQMIIIVIGMLWIGGEVSSLAGGVGVVVNHAMNEGKFAFFPAADPKEVIAFIAAAVTMMLGSIPQQDVFQRVQSAKSEKIAVWGSVLGGVLYFAFAFVPMFLAYSATLIDPAMVSRLIDTDSQMILPELVLSKAPLVAQILFFGALLSAIKSCASATLLAPLGDLHREHPQAGAARSHRQEAAVLDACGDLQLHRAGHPLRHGFRCQHLQDGGERLPGDPGGRLHSPLVRAVLAPRHQPGCTGFDLLRCGCVAGGACRRWRRPLHPRPTGRPAGQCRGHDRRFAGEAVVAPRPWGA